MYSNQRISGPYFPSHSTSSPSEEKLMNEQLNHWCEELDRCDPTELKNANKALDQRSKIIKLAPHTFMN